MRVWEYMPGVPAAGHVARGYWHPGRIDGCVKCEPAPLRRPLVARRQPREVSVLCSTCRTRITMEWSGVCSECQE